MSATGVLSVFRWLLIPRNTGSIRACSVRPAEASAVECGVVDAEALIITLRNASEGWLGSSCEERAASPQVVTFWGLAALDPSHPSQCQHCNKSQDYDQGRSFGWNACLISITFGFCHVAKTPPTPLLTHRNPRGKSPLKNAPSGAFGHASPASWSTTRLAIGIRCCLVTCPYLESVLRCCWAAAPGGLPKGMFLRGSIFSRLFQREQRVGGANAGKGK